MLLKHGKKLVNAFVKEYFTEKQRTPTRRHLLKWSVIIKEFNARVQEVVK